MNHIGDAIYFKNIFLFNVITCLQYRNKGRGSRLHGYSWLYNKFETSLDCMKTYLVHSPNKIDTTEVVKRGIQRLLEKNQNKMSFEYCIPSQSDREGHRNPPAEDGS